VSRQETPFGPVWLVPDTLGAKGAKTVARLDLAWDGVEGFDAAHTGPSPGGAYLVRAPRAALEARGLLTGSAAEVPVAEGTVWPPLADVGPATQTGYDVSNQGGDPS
jgi:hypothetical protein